MRLETKDPLRENYSQLLNCAHQPPIKAEINVPPSTYAPATLGYEYDKENEVGTNKACPSLLPGLPLTTTSHLSLKPIHSLQNLQYTIAAFSIKSLDYRLAQSVSTGPTHPRSLTILIELARHVLLNNTPLPPGSSHLLIQLRPSRRFQRRQLRRHRRRETHKPYLVG